MLIKPILFLIFNRPDLTQQVFEAIRQAKPRFLYVAADGPRENVEGEAEKCMLTRQIVTQVDWECEVKTLFRQKNLGCKIAVSSAIDWFFEQVEEGIILEDDTLPNQSFFKYCSLLLEHYRDNWSIMHISGNNFQSGIKRGEASYYFSYLNHIWGWATWRRSWRLYDVEMSKFDFFKKNNLIKQYYKKKPIQLFWMNMFEAAYKGSLNTWDAQWSFACIVNKGLSILPQVNLVSNIGFRDDATHTLSANSPLSRIPTIELQEIVHPTHIKIDKVADIYTYKNCFNVKFNILSKKLSFKYIYGILINAKKMLKNHK